jgi:hypothetical protein
LSQVSDLADLSGQDGDAVRVLFKAVVSQVNEHHDLAVT